jgi:asparagine synthase (glutamine-hydrolysing)
LTFWAPTAPRTLFVGVESLRPGEKLVVEGGRIRRERWWDWPCVPAADRSPVDARAAADELRALLIDATRLRLRADVPVGAYLSGGLDSSVLTTIIARHTDTPLRTFSLGFEDAGLDETPAQARMVAHLGTEHRAVLCRREDVASGFEAAVVAAENVLLRAAPVPMMHLSARVRAEGFRVVLTGEGADEVLGGYDLFKEAKIRQFWARQASSKARPRLLSRLYPYLDVNPTRAQAYLEAFFRQGLDAPDAPLFSHQPRMQTTARLKAFLNPERRWPGPEAAAAELLAELPTGFDALEPFHRAQVVECRTLLPGYLLSSQGDRMLMANSVEGRFPFLDHRLAEFALRLPPHLLMRGLTEKYLLKRAMGPELPREIVRRPKQPYRAPGSSAFLSAASRDATRAHLTPEALRAAGLFAPEPVERLLTKLEAGGPVGEKDNMALLGILSAQLIDRHFVRDFPDRLGFKPDADFTDSIIGPAVDASRPRRT